MEVAGNDIIKMAIACMDKATTGSREGGFELFGQYVASELRAITNPQAQRWAKL